MFIMYILTVVVVTAMSIGMPLVLPTFYLTLMILRYLDHKLLTGDKVSDSRLVTILSVVVATAGCAKLTAALVLGANS